MGSKKLKRRKLKCKKLQKLKKLRAIKQKKSNIELCKKVDCEETSEQRYSSDNRLSQRNYSRSHSGDKYISKVKNFSNIREDYFNYLQKVVKDNCMFYDSFVTEEMLENLSLELEQYALLACLQVDIYEKSMTKIISDIKKCTEEKQVHKEVKKLLPDSAQKKGAEMKAEQSLGSEMYSRIPTISSIRNDDNFSISASDWAEHTVYNTNVVNPDFSVENQYEETFHENESSSHWNDEENYSSQNYSSYWSYEVPKTNESTFENNQIITESDNVHMDNNVNKENAKEYSPDYTPQNFEKLDPLLISRNQLQKSVEQTLSNCEIVNKKKQDEKERAYIAHILEGSDSLEDRFNDSLSENENESKEIAEEINLTDRLEKMKEIFGIEEDSHIVSEGEKPQNNNNKVTRNRRPTIWRHEKIIQLHKFSVLSSEMSSRRREENQRLFLELFGEDSDAEHENEYFCEEKYRASCTERISSWIVKHLMPFYNEKRIVGRNVFKSLGHHISNYIIEEIQYPDEWTVKYFVSKFFPPRKKYVCDADILTFQPD